MIRLFFVFLLCTTPALAQHNHDRFHWEYYLWSSQRAANCCNNIDCGAIPDNQVRETEIGTQILIAGQWCLVQKQHRLIRGKSPDWSTAHACISGVLDPNPCHRLLCFVGKPLF